jgi:hypothetical protein
MVFEGLRERLERLLAEDDPSSRTRTQLSRLRETLIDAKAGVQHMREALVKTARKLEPERKHLADAERRGRLAAGISDSETAEIAERYAAKHGERVSVLERKLAAQRDELVLAQREVEEMTQRMKEAKLGLPPEDLTDSVKHAWRDLAAAGAPNPETDLRDELLGSELDQRAKEEAVEAQLERLKSRAKKGKK